LEIAYYDQMREQLDEEKDRHENITKGGDTIMINGKPRHVIGYLQDFLFTPDRAADAGESALRRGTQSDFFSAAFYHAVELFGHG
jgi:ATPase subunit of ABC transporter with duplicated ATPase domains